MHPLYSKADRISSVVIGAAIEVHRILGPGLLESIYERCLIHELKLRGLTSASQKAVHVRYKDITFEENLRFDIVVEEVPARRSQSGRACPAGSPCRGDLLPKAARYPAGPPYQFPYAKAG